VRAEITTEKSRIAVQTDGQTKPKTYGGKSKFDQNALNGIQGEVKKNGGLFINAHESQKSTLDRHG